jgi:hypothetical protein
MLLLAVGGANVQSATIVTLDNGVPATGYAGSDSVWVDSLVTFYIRFTYTPGDGSAITGSSNGFRIWTSMSISDPTTPGYFDSLSYDTCALGWSSIYDGGVFFGPLPAETALDALGADTLGFGGYNISAPGIVDGFDDTVIWFATVPRVGGDTLCIDSTFYRPTNNWLWSTNGSLGYFIPDWGGPYCYYVYDPSLDVKPTNEPNIPTTFSLGQNYPNPFNPTTEIRFDIAERTHVTLTIYNVVGQEVATLVDEVLQPRSYVVEWNGTTYSGARAASGVYFYKLEAGNFVDTKKMMLIK